MRTAAKIDANQAEIVSAFKSMGCTVKSLASVGRGFPDLIVGTHGLNLLVEIKGPKGELTPDQRRFVAGWSGGYDVVRTVDDVIRLVKTAREGIR